MAGLGSYAMLDLWRPFKLPEYFSVLQADNFVVRKSAVIANNSRNDKKNINIYEYVDSQAAIKAIISQDHQDLGKENRRKTRLLVTQIVSKTVGYRTVVDLVTDHNLLASHASRMDIINDDACRHEKDAGTHLLLPSGFI